MDILVLTKSFGYNLLKGNNKNFKVEGDVSVINEIRENVNIKIMYYYNLVRCFSFNTSSFSMFIEFASRENMFLDL